MRTIRFILAVLIGFSLAVTPVGNALAKSMAATEHCDKQAMDSDNNVDCPCCDKANACPGDFCSVTCFKISSAFPTANKLIDLMRQTYEPSAGELITFRSWPPPAPPPRA